MIVALYSSKSEGIRSTRAIIAGSLQTQSTTFGETHYTCTCTASGFHSVAFPLTLRVKDLNKNYLNSTNPVSSHIYPSLVTLISFLVVLSCTSNNTANSTRAPQAYEQQAL